MTVELLDTTDNEDSEDGFNEEKRRSTYQEKYASPAHHTDDEAAKPVPTASMRLQLPHFLPRCVRRSRRALRASSPATTAVKRERDTNTPTSSGER